MYFSLQHRKSIWIVNDVHNIKSFRTLHFLPSHVPSVAKLSTDPSQMLRPIYRPPRWWSQRKINKSSGVWTTALPRWINGHLTKLNQLQRLFNVERWTGLGRNRSWPISWHCSGRDSRSQLPSSSQEHWDNLLSFLKCYLYKHSSVYEEKQLLKEVK
jgi:hypothetical protein